MFLLVKGGYPPQPLTIIPELPVDSLGLKQGDQLVVTQKSGRCDGKTSCEIFFGSVDWTALSNAQKVWKRLFGSVHRRKVVYPIGETEEALVLVCCETGQQQLQV